MTEEKKEVTILEGGNVPAVIGEDVLSFLDEQAEQYYRPRLVEIKEVAKTGVFSAEGFGPSEKLPAIILATELRRALWPFGTNEEETAMAKWASPRPICSSRGNNGRKGELSKTLDSEAPDIIRQVAMPIMESNGICKHCQWGNFGDDNSPPRCRLGRRFLIWSPETKVCGVIAISPTSLGFWEDYLASISAGHFSRVITVFSTSRVEKTIRGRKNSWFTVHFESAGKTNISEMAPLARTVNYEGVEMQEIKAILGAFLQLDFDQDLDYPSNGSGDLSAADSDASDASSDDIDDF